MNLKALLSCYYILVSLLQEVLLEQSDNASIENNQIYEMNDSNFDNYISRNDYRWVMLFYLPTCGHCTRAREVFQKIYKDIEDPLMRFGQINTDQNMLTNFRFKPGNFPYIVMIHHGKMHEMTRYAGEKNIVAFLKEEKKPEDAIAIPPSMTIFGVVFNMAKSSLGISLLKLEVYIKNNRTAFIIGACVIGSILLIAIETIIMSYCCKSGKKKSSTVSKSNKTN